ncbi:MAG: SMI1/KNR4 family protein [Clostridia bacterium]|nr:SMI1/KNR4 family protein [Clostridia bacterium]
MNEKNNMLETALSLGYTFDFDLGLIFQKSDINEYCFPMDSFVFAHNGCGDYFCIIPEFGETVFQIESISADGRPVKPLAADFKQFIRLVLAVPFTGILLSIYRITKENFLRDVAEVTAPTETDRMQKVSQLANIFSLSPMEQPYESVRALQDTFPYEKIRFYDAYYDACGIDNPFSHVKPKFKETVLFQSAIEIKMP